MDRIGHDSDSKEQAIAGNEGVQHGKTRGCTTYHRTLWSKGKLNKHMREVHGGLIFQCERYHKSFKAKSNKSRHIRQLHVTQTPRTKIEVKIKKVEVWIERLSHKGRQEEN